MNNFLLTGAGFTYNFGGFLASEMWYEIFNAINSEEHKSLKDLSRRFSDKYDFEGFYSEVLNNDYPDEDKTLLRKIVEDAYKNLDSIIESPIIEHVVQINVSDLFHFIDRFENVFTTNQDLFFERNSVRSQHFAPGVGDTTTYRQKLGIKTEKNNYYLRLPTSEKLSEMSFPDNKMYVKLHGSCNWIDSKGNSAMVIGSLKDEQIKNEPLLALYRAIFRSQLNQTDTNLVIIGYGFKDKHINEIIKDAITNFGLRLFIISPSELNFVEHEINDGTISNAIEGYFKNHLSDIFTTNGRGRSEVIKKQLNKALQFS